MGFLLKIVAIFLFFYFLFRFLLRFFLGAGQRRGYNYRQWGGTNTRNQQPHHQPKDPETQEERILEYQKKSFESADAHDVEFEEIKD